MVEGLKFENKPLRIIWYLLSPRYTTVCKDYFERSWTVVEYMGWYDM